MAVTKTLISKSHGRAVYKIVGTAAADTATIRLKPVAVTSASWSANVATFNVTNHGLVTGDTAVISGIVSSNNVNGTYNLGYNGAFTSITVVNANQFTVAMLTNPGTYTSGGLSTSDDIIHITQYPTVASPKSELTKIWYSVSSSGDVTIVRNAVTIAKLFGHDTIEGFGLAEQAGENIVVTFNTSAGGTAIIEISKTSGYGSTF